MDGNEYMPQNDGEKVMQLPVTNEEQVCVCYKHNGLRSMRTCKD